MRLTVVLLGIGCGLLPARKSIDRQNGAMTRRNLGVALVGTLLLAGCTATAAGDDSHELPPAGASFDYQLAGPYAPPDGVSVVVRDSTADPAGADYDICYVNGFQTQPSETDGEGETDGEADGEADGEGEGEDASWLSAHPELILHDDDGDPVNDPDWPDEYLLDTSTALNRSTILALLGPAISSCAEAGYDAVEIDNLDSWSRSDGALTIEDNIAHARDLAEYTHALGLAIAQKNGAGYSQRLRDAVGFDFAVTEECMRYDECSDYIDAYDGLVFDIEYLDSEAGNSAAAFAAACDDPGHPDSMILRDLALSAPGAPGDVRETC
jgi:hypothetical protein